MIDYPNRLNKLQRFYFWFFIAFAIFMIVCLIINCFFNSAEADVYTYAFITKQLGIIEAQKYWYLHWSGRIIPTFILSFGEYFIRNNWAYQLFSCFLIFSFCITVYVFVKKCFVFSSNLERYFIVAIFILTIIQMFASVSSAFYWLPASITYTAPILLGFWSLYFFFSDKIIFRLLGLLILFLFTLFNEITDLLMILLFVYLLFIQYSNKKLRKQLLLAIIVVIVGSFILFVAPGNYERKNYTHDTLNLAKIFFYSNKAFFKDAIAWFVESPLLLFSLLFIIISDKSIEINLKLKSYIFKNNAVLFIFIYIVLLIPYAIFEKLGGCPPERVVNIVSYTFFLSAVFIFTKWLNNNILIHKNININYPVKLYISIVVTGLILYGFNIHSKNISSIITDATSGKGKSYYNEYSEQLKQLSKSKRDTVYIRKINSVAKSILFEVLDNDTTKSNYSQYCLYFNKKKIIVQ